MDVDRLKKLGARRRRARAAYELAHREALDAALEELGGPDANVSVAADLIGVIRQTIYNERARVGRAV